MTKDKSNLRQKFYRFDRGAEKIEQAGYGINRRLVYGSKRAEQLQSLEELFEKIEKFSVPKN